MAGTNIFGLFITIMIVQLFFSVGITTITYAIPNDSLPYVTSFSDITGQINVETVGAQVSEGLQKQTNIPVLDLGALIFYSGNILIDLILNFAFAIPEMIGLIIFSMTRLVNLPVEIVYYAQVFFSVVILASYFLGVIQLLTSIRSGRVI